MPENREGHLRQVAEGLRDVRKALGYPQDAGGRSRVSPRADKASYMRRLQASVRSPRAPTRRTPPGNNPFDNYLLDVTHEIKAGTSRLSERLKAEGEAARAVSGEVVCCVISGIYEVLRGRNQGDAVDRVREVAEGDVRDWVRLLREILVAFQSTLSTGPLSGKLNVEIRMLKKDISAMLLESAEQSLSSLLFMVHELLADQARSLDGRMSDAIANTRCGPLMRIWGAIFDFIFGGASSIIARTRMFFRDKLVSSARERHEVLHGQLGSRLDSADYYLHIVTDLIEILDAILAALSIFSICRLSPRGNVDEDIEDPTPRAEEGRGTATQDRRRPPRRRGSFTGEAELPNPELIPEGYGVVRRTDPVLGEVDVAVPDFRNEQERRAESTGAAAQNMLYLTPMNTALFMHEAFGTSVDQAVALATEQDCRNQLTDETEEVLRQLGLIDD